MGGTTYPAHPARRIPRSADRTAAPPAMSNTPTLPTEPAPTGAPRLGFWARTTDRVHRFLLRVLYLLAPIAATGLVLLIVWWQRDWDTVRQVTYAGAASLFGLGTSVVFGKAVLHDAKWLTLSTWELAFVVMWVNAASSYFYTWNFDLLERLPKIGRALHAAREDARLALDHRRWIRRLSTIGVGAFVISPLPGSGSLAGSIMGQMIGLSRRATALTVTCAGAIVCVSYAVLARRVEGLLKAVPWWVNAGGVLILLISIWFVMRWMRRTAARVAEQARREQAAAASDPTSPAPDPSVPSSVT